MNTQTGFRYGFYTFLGYTAYFLLMKLVGLVHIVELRAFNGAILGSGIWLAINHLIHHPSAKFDYYHGFRVGVITAFSGVIMFSIFMFFYLRIIDQAFLMQIKEQEAFGQYLNPYIIAVTLIIEGSFSGFIMTFAIMQFKKSKAGKFHA
ncbi:hypothetical protein AAG747_19495 [Rapidithrix thailandica]|uniref:DUF4199 domain-containing protein n=1 Tax=Rapidithrix thailandica TaxID=413964 RepID=A0AAW9SFS1_9BACT